ncbi:hypothetical protein AB0F43_34320 [Kribbella sp. NPDC023972]|uniref:hypothetical protein n=1 Tax=Kribbella sp. NPDC023972 TaxID=3154795 RepID=UPI0033E734D6
MKLHRNSLLTAAAIVLVLYLVCLAVGLPTWPAIVLTVVLLVLLTVVWKQPDPPRPVATPMPPPPSVVLPDRDPVFTGPPSRTVADVRLPSASPDFQFSFSAVVQWSTVLSGSRHADLGAVAVHALLERARALTATQQVTEESLNQHRLAAILGEPALDEKGQVRCWATEVRLRLPDADQKHLQHLAALHRREQTTLLERRIEQDKRAYLKEDVFATPGSAAVWWLVNNPGEVENAVGLLATLAELSAAANDLPVRRSSAEVMDRPHPTRAELDFNSAVGHLLESGEPAPESTTPSRPSPRHAGPHQADNPAPPPPEATGTHSADGTGSRSTGAANQQPSNDVTSPRTSVGANPRPPSDGTSSRPTDGTTARSTVGANQQPPSDVTSPRSTNATSSRSTDTTAPQMSHGTTHQPSADAANRRSSNDGVPRQPTNDGVPRQPTNDGVSRQPLKDDVGQQAPNNGNGTRPSNQRSDNGTSSPPAEETAAARNGAPHPSKEQPEGKYREQFYSE